jgi:GPI mannosyltransferase 1 subunit M
MGLKKHLCISIVIRILLIIYGEIQDQISEIPYTDIDYRVVTDGARHILNNRSPFARHTYRFVVS